MVVVDAGNVLQHVNREGELSGKWEMSGGNAQGGCSDLDDSHYADSVRFLAVLLTYSCQFGKLTGRERKTPLTVLFSVR